MSKPIQPRPNGRAAAKAASSALAAVDGPAHKSTGLVKSGDRAADIVVFEESVISFFVEAADLIGAPKSIAAIYGICFASPDPIGFAEIQERLDLSIGSISQGLRVLREIGALKISDRFPSAVSHPLSAGVDTKRRDYYEPNLEARKLITSWLDQKLKAQLNSGRGQLEAITRTMPKAYRGRSGVVRERLDHLKNWHSKARTLLPVAMAMLKTT